MNASTTCGSMAYFNTGIVKPGESAHMSFPVGQMYYEKTYNGYDKTDVYNQNSGNEITTIDMPSSERMGYLRHDHHYPCCNP